MSIQDIYGSAESNFLKSADLQGQSPVVLIDTATVEEPDFGDGKKPQIVLTFKGAQKKLGLNKTNAMELARLFGTEDWTRWQGQQIKLYVTKVKYKDQMVDAIRIFPELPMYAQQPQTQQQFVAPPQPPVPTAPVTAQAPVANDDQAPF